MKLFLEDGSDQKTLRVQVSGSEKLPEDFVSRYKRPHATMSSYGGLPRDQGLGVTAPLYISVYPHGSYGQPYYQQVAYEQFMALMRPLQGRYRSCTH